MSDVRIKSEIVADDGSDGFFFRNGDKWLRQDGKEVRLLDLAPVLESLAVANLNPDDIEARAMRASTEWADRRTAKGER